MNNLLSGAGTRQEAKCLIKQTTEMLRSGRLNLCKWASNDPSLLNKGPEGFKEVGLHELPTKKANEKMLTIKHCRDLRPLSMAGPW